MGQWNSIPILTNEHCAFKKIPSLTQFPPLEHMGHEFSSCHETIIMIK